MNVRVEKDHIAVVAIIARAAYHAELRFIESLLLPLLPACFLRPLLLAGLRLRRPTREKLPMKSPRTVVTSFANANLRRRGRFF